MKVTIGICSLGNGHTYRQLQVAKMLRNNGHNVRIIVESGDKADRFRAEGFDVLESWLPLVPARPDGRVYASDLWNLNRSSTAPGLRRFREIVRILGDDEQDLFITDYEPNAAYAAMLLRKPLMTLDQQGKYRYLPMPRLDGPSHHWEKARQVLLMPRMSRALICSFVPMETGRPWQRIIPPIIDPSLQSLEVTADNHVTAYFSRYFDSGPETSVTALAEIFRKPGSPTVQIFVHAPEYPAVSHLESDTVKISPVHRSNFLESMRRSRLVITNGGFNLISESIALGKPVHTIPLPTYDQNWCARTVEQYRIGTAAPRVTEDAVIGALAGADRLRRSILDLRDAHFLADPLAVVLDEVHRLAGARSGWRRRSLHV
ncbi:glycosyltransferase family protein [Microbacterium foliorum]|uniref:glycosyltransferase family protein n=1 Tax=Microbacterium foliorum TaxID=104336 RepID=UPI0028D12865|nr:glycosyltransferase family protein [Microbacterium foliorum]